MAPPKRRIVLTSLPRRRLAQGVGLHSEKVFFGESATDTHIHLLQKDEVRRFNEDRRPLVPHTALDARTVFEHAEADNVGHLGLLRHHELIPADPAIIAEAKRRGMVIEFGGEFNVRLGGDHVHMGVMVPIERHADFNAWLRQYEPLNKELALETITYLGKTQGFDTGHITEEAITQVLTKQGTKYITKRLIAELLLRNPRNRELVRRMGIKKYQDFKRAFLRRGKVPFTNYSIKSSELIPRVTALGGSVTLAHPLSTTRGTSKRNIIRFAEERRGHAIEVGTPSHDEEKTARIIKIVKSIRKERGIPIRASATADMHSREHWARRPISEELFDKMVRLIDTVPQQRK